MYSDSEKYFPRRRSGDEFLRRMRGEDFLSGMTSGGDAPTVSQSALPRVDERPKVGCNGDRTGDRAGGFTHETTTSVCRMPSLAMVYSPVQPWQKTLAPEVALQHGSLFAELIFPLEAGNGGNCFLGGCKR